MDKCPPAALSIIFGTVIDPKMSDGVKITVIATGFDPAISSGKREDMERKLQQAQQAAEPQAAQPPAFGKGPLGSNSPGGIPPFLRPTAQPARQMEAMAANKPKEGTTDPTDLDVPTFLRNQMD